VLSPQLFRAEAEAFGRSGSKVLHEDVGPSNELTERLFRPVTLEI
jgi:hypothetical protein